MIELLAVIASQLLCAAPPVVTELDRRTIHLADLAEMVSPAPANAAPIVIAHIPAGSTRVEIDEAAARRLIANRVPNARFELRFEDKIVFSAPPAKVKHATCFAAAHNIASGSIISKSDVTQAQCSSEPVASALSFDRQAQAPIAAQEIFAGSYLGPISPASDAQLARGANVVLVTGGNGVRVSRSVSTLQAGRAGQMVFVLTMDGQVFAVPFENLEEK